MELSFDTSGVNMEGEAVGEIVSWEVGTPMVSASWLVARMGGVRE